MREGIQLNGFNYSFDLFYHKSEMGHDYSIRIYLSLNILRMRLDFDTSLNVSSCRGF